MLSRRRFLELAVLSGLAACTSSDEYTSEDAQRLSAQMAQEAAASGKGRFGPLRFAGYRDLARLPYFKVGADGLLHTVVELPKVIDFHAHLGWSNFLAPKIDLLKPAPRTEYLMDCDA